MIDVDIRIEDARWGTQSELETLIVEVLRAAQAEAGEVYGEVDVAILFADDAAQAALNREHRGKDGSTNVLSFPAAETPLPPGMPRPLGDMSLAYETVAEEARVGGISLDAHLRHLIIHGFLHLLGYDHQTDAEATVMETTETRALARLGIADPYGPEAGVRP